MLYPLFIQILNMSVIAVPMIITVMLFRLFVNRIPHRFICILWAVILFRLLCPFVLESEWSGVITDPLFHATAEPLSVIVSVEATEPLPENGGMVLAEQEKAAAAQVQEASAKMPENDWFQLLVFGFGPYIWVIGLAVFALYSIVSTILLRRKLTCAIKLRDNIYLADHLASSFVTGILRPKIYISSELTEAERPYVILHEKMHIRRGDHIIKLFAWLALCIHWFNPLVWGMFQFFGDDIEMACDEAVLRKHDADIRADYAELLLRITAGRTLPVGTPLAFGEGDIKMRIANIMRYEKPSKIIVLVSVLAMLILTLTIGTNPVENQTELAGADYQMVDVVYANGSVEQLDNGHDVMHVPYCAGEYSFAADGYLYERYNTGEGWIELGQTEPYPLTKKELLGYCHDLSSHKVSSITDAAILRLPAENDRFYLLMQTKQGETLLACGWEDVSERGQGASDDTYIRWIIQLESEFNPDGVQVNYFMRSLRHVVNDSVDTFEFWENSKYTPGYLIVGFTADGASEDSDMGYAVFRWVGNCLKMLDCHVYANAAIEGNRIYHAEPAVLSEDGALTDAVTYDVILNNNPNLACVVRVVTYADGSQKELSAEVFRTPALVTFRWADENSFIQNFNSETRVSQYFYDKDGNILTDE